MGIDGAEIVRPKGKLELTEEQKRAEAARILALRKEKQLQEKSCESEKEQPAKEVCEICQNIVSKNTYRCPHCGEPTKNTKRSVSNIQKAKTIFLIPAVLLIIYIVYKSILL